VGRSAMQTLDDLAQTLDLGADRGHVLLELGVALFQVGVFATEVFVGRQHAIRRI